MKQRSLLKRNGASFRSEAEENQAVTGAAQGPVQLAPQARVREFPKKRPHRRRKIACSGIRAFSGAEKSKHKTRKKRLSTVTEDRERNKM